MDALEFKSIVLPMSKKLLHFAYLLLRETAEAEDAVQEVCLKLWKIRDSLEKYNSLEAFAMRVTKNWCLDRLRAKKLIYIESYHTGFDRLMEESDPQRMLENADGVKILNVLLEKLPEQQRIIFQLRDLEGLEYEEIAEIMDMNNNAIRVNLSRARNKIKEELYQYDGYGNQSNKKSAGKIL
jgi:RNA polymerase sigma-70 factor (ECF subfamily)